MSTFERFVLIDDNEADNVFHEIMIRRAGFAGELAVFENGIDALDFFEQDRSALKTCVCLDINMPAMDGFEVAEKLAPMLDQRTPTTVVMLTSSDNPRDQERAGTIPLISAYLIKPLDVAAAARLMAGTPAP